MYQVTLLKPSKIDPNGIIRQKMLFTPEGISVMGVTLGDLIREAYGLGEDQITGAPEWINSARYDLEAKLDKSVADELRKLSPDQITVVTRRMRQSLLADHFKLTLHSETKELQRYNLVVAEDGPKLQEAKSAEASARPQGPDGLGHPGMMRMGPGSLDGRGLHVGEVAGLLSHQLGRTVVDQTGLKGTYDVELRWTPREGELPLDKSLLPKVPIAANAPLSDPSGPFLFDAIQEQLGLELKPQQSQVQILAIDHVEKPLEN
jgi:uncharacterized protein (TIGR03435 family)